MSGFVVCPRCPTFGEWHHEHALEVGPVPVFDRATLVRAVLGQQWREAFTILFQSEWGLDNESHRVWPWPHDLEAVGVEFPSADDVVADILGEVEPC